MMPVWTKPLAGLMAVLGALSMTMSCGDPARCNGWVELCERTLDRVAFVQTHNSHATQEGGYHAGAMNHLRAVPAQLADGVRSLNFDVHYDKDKDQNKAIYLCHGFCVLGKQPIQEAFGQLRQFLAAHPGEILLLIFENNITRDELVAEIQKSGLDAYAHAQQPGATWPTLGEMVESGRRLVFFSRDSGGPAWFHTQSAHIYSTGWGVKNKEDLSCKPTSAVIDDGLFQLNHNLTHPIASPDLARQINFNPFLLQRVRQCAAEVGRPVNMVNVDFYSIGDVLSVVNTLNGVL